MRTIQTLRLQSNYTFYRQLVNGVTAVILAGLGLALFAGVIMAIHQRQNVVSVVFPLFLGSSLVAFLTLAWREAALMLADAADAVFLTWRQQGASEDLRDDPLYASEPEILPAPTRGVVR